MARRRVKELTDGARRKNKVPQAKERREQQPQQMKAQPPSSKASVTAESEMGDLQATHEASEVALQPADEAPQAEPEAITKPKPGGQKATA